MSEKQWTWVFHIKGQPSQSYLRDEVEDVLIYPAVHPKLIEVLMKNGQKHYYPLSEVNSWHLLELLKREPQTYKRMRMGAY
jgi:hypothetical protein